jgi:meso-butanediol dehydrogenase / (S,S)-butanediol dehydrogenase / diacetyl reductase
MAGRLDGRIALVTGAASGLGAAPAARFGAEGAVVVGLDLVPSAAAEESHVADVTDEDAVAAVVRAVVGSYGRLDVVANFAGTVGGGPVHWVDRADWDRVIAVNLTGTFLLNKHALFPMLEQRSGSIINIASIEGIEGTEGGSVYNASKGAVVLLTKNMAIDYGRAGIRVNCICPGFIQDTELFRFAMGSEGMAPFLDRYREQAQLGRFGHPDEIAGAALFLASDDASYVTGHSLVVDGGFTTGMRTALSDRMGI